MQRDMEHKEDVTQFLHSKEDATILLDDCDPWLSRAAREILRRHLSHGDDEMTVWDWIEQFTSSDTMRTCPLHGIDVLRRQEEQTLRIPSRKLPAVYASLDRNNHDHGSKKDPFWYQCGLCQKTFLTRFYFDRHMKRNHRQDERFEHNNNTRLLCPAQHWCHFLVDCYDVAVEREPYYSAGSEQPAVALSVQQRTPPCQEETLQATLRACRTMVDTCFSHHESLHEYLQRHLCAPQTCQDRLHRILFKSSPSSLGLSSSSLRQTEWRMLYAFLLTSVLVVGFFVAYYHRNYVQRRRRPRSRLLQKPHRAWFRSRSYKNSTNHCKQKLS